MTVTVRKSVHVKVDPATAFAVFTDEVGDWYRIDEYTVLDSTKTVTLRFEPFVGGRFIDVYDASTGDGRTVGRIVAWEPGKKLAFTDARDIEVVVTFAAADGGTEVTVEQSGLDKVSPETAAHIREHGWHVYLPEWFASYLGDPAV